VGPCCKTQLQTYSVFDLAMQFDGSLRSLHVKSAVPFDICLDLWKMAIAEAGRAALRFALGNSIASSILRNLDA